MTIERPGPHSWHAVSISTVAVPVTTVFACGLMLLMVGWPALSNKFYIADDFGAFTIPMRHLYMEGLRAGRVDLWCSALFGGFYMHGEGQTGMFHPMHLLLYRFVPFVQAINLEIIATYFVLFSGSYFLFRQWVPDRLAAAFGAFVFSLAGNNLMQIVHTNQVAIVAHAPWLMIALKHCIVGDERYRTRWCMVVALLNGSELLLGYPYYYLMSTALQVWYVLYLTGGKMWSRGVLRAGLATAMGILIGAVQLVPTWSALKASSRASPTPDFLSGVSLHPLNLLQWANPYFFIWRKFGAAGPHELCIYAGIGPLLLFAWLCTKRDDPNRRLIVFLIALAALGVFLSLGKYNGLFAVYSRFPGFNLFRVPARYMLFTNFALAGASALALHRLRTMSSCFPTWRFRLFLAGLFALSVSTVAIKVFWTLTSNHHNVALGSVRATLLGSAIVCAVITLFWFALRSRAWGLIGFWVFAFCDMASYSGTYLQALPTGGMHYYEAAAVPVAAPGPIFVTDGRPQGTNNNMLTVGGYQLADGYAGLEPKLVLPMNDPKYLMVLGATAVQGTDGKWSIPPTPLQPIRLALPFLSDHPIEAMNSVDLASMAVVTQQVTVDNAATGSVRIVAQYPGFIHIDAQTSGRELCVLAQRFHPGWTARIGERNLQLFAVDGDLTGFVLPGGKQDVILEFLPRDFFLGRNITFAALASVLAALCFGLIFTRRTRNLLKNSGFVSVVHRRRRPAGH